MYDTLSRYLEELRHLQVNRSKVETRGEDLWWEDIAEGVAAVQVLLTVY